MLVVATALLFIILRCQRATAIRAATPVANATITNHPEGGNMKASPATAFLIFAGFLIAALALMRSSWFDSLGGIGRCAVVVAALAACVYLWRSSLS